MKFNFHFGNSTLRESNETHFGRSPFSPQTLPPLAPFNSSQGRSHKTIIKHESEKKNFWFENYRLLQRRLEMLEMIENREKLTREEYNDILIFFKWKSLEIFNCHR